MAATDQNEQAAALLERLLKDKAFRASFRKNPAEAARKYGLDELAEELSGKGKALYTLEIRESRSSLAGMLMAAAAEGVSASDLADQVGQGQPDTPAQIALTRALSRVNLDAVAAPGGAGAAGGATAESAEAAGVEAVDPEASGPALTGDGHGLDSGIFAGIADKQDAPAPSDTLQFSAVNGPPQAQEAAGAAAEQPAPQGAAADVVSASAGEVGGGQATIEAVINDPDLHLPPEAVADLRSGDIDPRAVMLLHKLGNSGHEVGLSVIKSGHRQFTSGGSVSNHFVGRGFDVAMVDGQPVTAENAGARDIADQLAEMDPNLRPTEIGTPWQIDKPGFFTDSAHCNHLHIGWDGPCPEQIRAEFNAGSGVAAPEAAGAAAPAGEAAAQVAPVVEEAGQNVGRQSGVFAGIVEAEAKKEAQAGAQGTHSTVQFMDAVQPDAPPSGAASEVPPPQQAAEVPPDEHVIPAVVDALPGEYPGDDAPKEEIARWMAARAQAAGLPAELPVMAALVESNLTNVNYGDADSLGYFQMRTSIWDKGEYAGFSSNPELQLKWFIDNAVAVKEKRIARGYTDFEHDPNRWGDWIADVERPAEQYRGRYQLRLDEAQGLLGAPPAS